jgi:hypothetical protein
MGRGTVMYRLVNVALYVRFERMVFGKHIHQIPRCQRSVNGVGLLATNMLMTGALDDSLPANFRLSRSRLAVSGLLVEVFPARTSSHAQNLPR